MVDKKVKGSRRRFAGSDEAGHPIIRWSSYTISKRALVARKRELLRAGYLPDEITRVSRDLEIGLLSLTLHDLRRIRLLGGRRQHVKDLMRDKSLSRRDAINRAVRDFRYWGGIKGVVKDYIAYYYHRYG